jgi:hypothetical protein
MSTQTPENPIASALAARAWNEVTAGDKVFRVRRLRPAELAQVGLAIAFIQGIVGSARAGDGEDRTLLGDDSEESAVENGSPPRELSPEMARLLEEMEKIAVSAVRQVRLTAGRQWYPLRLVRAIEDQDPAAGLVYIGSVAPADVLRLGTAALSDLLEAAESARPFPGSS